MGFNCDGLKMGAKRGKYAMGLGLRDVGRPQSLVLRLGQTAESQQLRGRKGRAQTLGLSDLLSCLSLLLLSQGRSRRQREALFIIPFCLLQTQSTFSWHFIKDKWPDPASINAEGKIPFAFQCRGTRAPRPSSAGH